MKDIDYLIWLNSIHGIGYATIEKFIKYFGSLKNIWNAPASEIYNFPKIKTKVVDELMETKNANYINSIKDKILKNGAKCILKTYAMYPDTLKNISKPPYMLYMKGDIIEEDFNAIAIVGSRKCTSYGKSIAYKFAKELAEYGITIISGMAYGIDSAAHRGAIDGGGRTIAVLGCGVDICYPKSNVNLMKNIIENGAVLSEYCLGTEPISGNFPRRNRIISGLSRGILVVEAGLRSGSLITTEYALQQGKDVFAIPGNINSSVSKGTNELIKEGAKVVTCVEDILEEYNIQKTNFDNKDKYSGLSQIERSIIEIIEKKQPIHIDMISSILNLRPSEVNSVVTILEIKDFIEQLPGKIIILK